MEGKRCVELNKHHNNVVLPPPQTFCIMVKYMFQKYRYKFCSQDLITFISFCDRIMFHNFICPLHNNQILYGYAFRFVFALGLAILCGSALQAQTLSIVGVDTKDFPTVRVKFSATDAQGKPIKDLDPSNFGPVYEKVPDKAGYQNREVLTVNNCGASDPTATAKSLSITMSFDVSGSMFVMPNYPKNSFTNLAFAQETARTLINILRFPHTEVAVQYADHRRFLAQDFTTDKSAVLSAFPGTLGGGNNEFYGHLMDPLNGLLTIAKTSKRHRDTTQHIALLLSDALWPYAMGDDQENSCINVCRSNGIKFYAVLFGQTKTPTAGSKLTMADSFRRIAKETGGKIYENILTQEQAEELGRELYAQALGSIQKEVCELTYKSAASCSDAVYEAFLQLLKPSNISSDVFQYAVTRSSAIPMTVSPASLPITGPSTGVREGKITLTAPGTNPYQVFLTSSDPRFEIPPSVNVPTGGLPTTVTIKYNGLGDGYAFGKITLYSPQGTICPSEIFVSAGIPGSKPAQKSLEVVFPNGGEVLIARSDTVVKWKGVLPSDAVKIEYTIDSGKTWKTMAERAGGLSYSWKGIDDTTSTRCLLRVSQLGPDIITPKPLDFTDLTGSNGSRAAFFSPLDQYIIAAGSQNTGLWSGSPPYSRRGNSSSYGGGAFASFSQANHIVAGSWQFGEYYLLYSPSPTQAITQIASDGVPKTDPIQSVVFNRDGSQILVAQSQQVAVLNANDNQKQKIASRAVMGVQNAYFSPSGNYIMVAMNTIIQGKERGVVKIWNTSDFIKHENVDAMYSFQTPDKLNHAAYHPVSDWNIVTAQSDGTARIWTIPSDFSREAQNQTTIIHNKQGGFRNVNSAFFSPDGQYITTAGDDGFAKIWFVSDGQPATSSEFNHTSGPAPKRVFTAVLSSDNRKLLTTSEFVAPRVWENFPLLSEPLQTDSSDNFWSIIQPKLTVQSVDMGEVVVGTIKEKTDTLFFTNNSPVPIIIQNIGFERGGAGVFQALTLTPITIPANSRVAAEFRFTPNNIGQFVDNIVVTTNYGQVVTLSDGQKPTIRGVGVDYELINTLEGSVIDFGKILVNSTKDSSTFIQNKGKSKIFIDSLVAIWGTKDGSVFRKHGPKSLWIEPGASQNLIITFGPPAVGRFSGMYAAYYNGAGSPVTVQVFGEGILPEVKTEHSLRLSDTTFKLRFPSCLAKDTTVSVRLSTTGSLTLLQPRNAHPLVSTIINLSRFTLSSPSDTLSIMGLTISPPSRANLLLKDSVELWMEKPTRAKLGAVILEVIRDSLGLEYQNYNPAITIQFPPVDVDKETTMSVVIRNTGTDTLRWKSLLPITLGAPFTIIKAEPELTLPGSSSQLTIRFAGGESNKEYTSNAPIVYGCRTLPLKLYAKVNKAPEIPPFTDIIGVSQAISSTKTVCGKTDNVKPVQLLLNNDYRGTTFAPPEYQIRWSGDTGWFELPSAGKKTMPVGKPLVIEIPFMPRSLTDTSLKTVNAVITFSFAGKDTVMAPLTFTAKNDLVELRLVNAADTLLDFGMVKGDSVQRRTIALRNTGSLPVTLTQPRPIDRFGVESLQPATVQPGQTVTLVVRFTAPPATIDGQTFSSTLSVSSFAAKPELCSSFSINLKAVVPAEIPPKITVYLGTASGRPGDTVRVPLMLTKKDLRPNDTTISGVLSYNASILKPLGPLPEGYVETGMRYIPLTFRIPATTAALDTVMYLRFRCALGNDTWTKLVLDSLVLSGTPRFTLNHAVGAVSLFGVAQAGGTRLINSRTDALLLKNFSPNPVRDEITVEFWSEAVMEVCISISDLTGRILVESCVKAVVGDNPPQKLKVAQIPPGPYFLNLRSPLQSFSRKIVIER